MAEAAEAADAGVFDVPAHSRFEVRVGDDLAGFSEYRRRPGLIVFTHTLIDPRFEGHGLGTKLITAALNQARADGLAVLPFCPFVRSYIADHPADFLDLVPREFRDAFDLPTERLND
jgi:predicted GNAT family acetyltransferase